MILDVVKRSLARPSVVIPVEQLLGNADGSRMPEVHAASLTSVVAQAIVNACPTTALTLDKSQADEVLVLNYGECIGCGRCIEAGQGAVGPARSVHCGVAKPQLVRRFHVQNATELIEREPQMAQAAREIRALLGRALNIRQVDTGSCNACEAEIVALTNPYYDLERFGIHFVASPKHADMLLVTGPVTRNMMEALKQTYNATPNPKLVVAVGACACSGGIFAGGHAVIGSVDSVIPVDAYIPGCPPTPAMILSGILEVLRRKR